MSATARMCTRIAYVMHFNTYITRLLAHSFFIVNKALVWEPKRLAFMWTFAVGVHFNCLRVFSRQNGFPSGKRLQAYIRLCRKYKANKHIVNDWSWTSVSGLNHRPSPHVRYLTLDLRSVHCTQTSNLLSERGMEPSTSEVCRDSNLQPCNRVRRQRRRWRASVTTLTHT